MGPYQIGIIIWDGAVLDVFKGETQTLPEGDVQTYVVTAAPVKFTFTIKGQEQYSHPDDIVLDPLLVTSDGQHVTGRVDLTVSVVAEGSEFTPVIPEKADRLLQLLGLYGDAVTEAKVAEMIKGELLPKLLALDFSGYTAGELRSNRESKRSVANSLKTELASAIDRFGLQLDDFYINWAPQQPQKAAPTKRPERDSRPEDLKARKGGRTSAPAKSAPRQTRAQDSQSIRGSRSSPARRQPVRKRETGKPVMQRLDESGLFNSGVRGESRHYKVSLQVKGWRGATIFVTHDGSEFLIKKRALKDEKFPNNDRLHDFALSHAHGTECGKEHRTSDFAISGEHLEEVIEMIRSGLQENPKSRRASRPSQTRRKPASKRTTKKSTVHMSALQQLRHSGLFDEGSPQPSSGTVHFQVKGMNAAAIYVLKNEREIHLRDGALRNNRFPNNQKLYDFVRRYKHGMAHGEGNSAYAFKLEGEHITEIIEMIRSGL